MTALARLAEPERLLIRWGMEADNLGGQRFYRRLGAALRPKVVATWTPDAYLAAVEGERRAAPGDPKEEASRVPS
jgi:hypothetical protein